MCGGSPARFGPGGPDGVARGIRAVWMSRHVCRRLTRSRSTAGPSRTRDSCRNISISRLASGSVGGAFRGTCCHCHCCHRSGRGVPVPILLAFAPLPLPVRRVWPRSGTSQGFEFATTGRVPPPPHGIDYEGRTGDWCASPATGAVSERVPVGDCSKGRLTIQNHSNYRLHRGRANARPPARSLLRRGRGVRHSLAAPPAPSLHHCETWRHPLGPCPCLSRLSPRPY